ncbi:MAG: glutamine synthetase [Deltaproteobacteria bacterium]|nr:glutamine synthetase [Deltaproteobacteria bacterium]
MDRQQFEHRVEQGELDTVIAAFPDPYGRLMGKRIPARLFAEQHMEASPIHACNYLLTADMELEPLPGFAFTSWDKGYGDMGMLPDLKTLRAVPWFEGSALVICDLIDHHGEPLALGPRQILKAQIRACEKAGLRPMMASELEFFLFRGLPHELRQRGFQALEPSTDYLIDYDILGTSADEPLLRDIRLQMPQAEIPIESSKGEWGQGQHEVNFIYGTALEAADRHAIFKQGVRQLATRHGVSATFMAKVSEKMAGSSCHIHASLWRGDKTAFWDEKAECPSADFGHFLAGCMRRAREFSLFFAPLPNSYKRYQAASFAPVSVAWGVDNRTCGFRAVGQGAGARIENRIPGADVNPYLAFAATLAAGLDGVAQKLEPDPPFEGNAYACEGIERVPRTMPEAIRTLEASELAGQAFGEQVVEHYLRLARLEQAGLDRYVTDWERMRYFERI